VLVLSTQYVDNFPNAVWDECLNYKIKGITMDLVYNSLFRVDKRFGFKITD